MGMASRIDSRLIGREHIGEMHRRLDRLYRKDEFEEKSASTSPVFQAYESHINALEVKPEHHDMIQDAFMHLVDAKHSKQRGENDPVTLHLNSSLAEIAKKNAGFLGSKPIVHLEELRTGIQSYTEYLNKVSSPVSKDKKAELERKLKLMNFNLEQLERTVSPPDNKDKIKGEFHGLIELINQKLGRATVEIQTGLAQAAEENLSRQMMDTNAELKRRLYANEGVAGENRRLQIQLQQSQAEFLLLGHAKAATDLFAKKTAEMMQVMGEMHRAHLEQLQARVSEAENAARLSASDLNEKKALVERQKGALEQARAEHVQGFRTQQESYRESLEGLGKKYFDAAESLRQELAAREQQHKQQIEDLERAYTQKGAEELAAAKLQLELEFAEKFQELQSILTTLRAENERLTVEVGNLRRELMEAADREAATELQKITQTVASFGEIEIPPDEAGPKAFDPAISKVAKVLDALRDIRPNTAEGKRRLVEHQERYRALAKQFLASKDTATATEQVEQDKARVTSVRNRANHIAANIKSTSVQEITDLIAEARELRPPRSLREVIDQLTKIRAEILKGQPEPKEVVSTTSTPRTTATLVQPAVKAQQKTEQIQHGGQRPDKRQRANLELETEPVRGPSRSLGFEALPEQGDTEIAGKVAESAILKSVAKEETFENQARQRADFEKAEAVERRNIEGKEPAEREVISRMQAEQRALFEQLKIAQAGKRTALLEAYKAQMTDTLEEAFKLSGGLVGAQLVDRLSAQFKESAQKLLEAQTTGRTEIELELKSVVEYMTQLKSLTQLEATEAATRREAESTETVGFRDLVQRELFENLAIATGNLERQKLVNEYMTFLNQGLSKLETSLERARAAKKFQESMKELLEKEMRNRDEIVRSIEPLYAQMAARQLLAFSEASEASARAEALKQQIKAWGAIQNQAGRSSSKAEESEFRRLVVSEEEKLRTGVRSAYSQSGITAEWTEGLNDLARQFMVGGQKIVERQNAATKIQGVYKKFAQRKIEGKAEGVPVSMSVPQNAAKSDYASYVMFGTKLPPGLLEQAKLQFKTFSKQQEPMTESDSAFVAALGCLLLKQAPEDSEIQEQAERFFKKYILSEKKELLGTESGISRKFNFTKTSGNLYAITLPESMAALLRALTNPLESLEGAIEARKKKIKTTKITRLSNEPIRVNLGGQSEEKPAMILSVQGGRKLNFDTVKSIESTKYIWTPPAENSIPWTSPANISDANVMKEALERAWSPSWPDNKPPASLDFMADIARSEELKPEFLARFPDAGVSFLRTFVYPYEICRLRIAKGEHPEAEKFFKIAASADDFLSTLDSKATLQEQAGLLSRAIAVMSRGKPLGLAGSPLSKQQIELLTQMNKGGRFRADAGAGKSTCIAIYPYLYGSKKPILHVSPFPVAQEVPGVTCLTIEEFKALPIERKLNSTIVLDEWDSPRYMGVQRALLERGVKYFEMSATLNWNDLEFVRARNEHKLRILEGQLGHIQPGSEEYRRVSGIIENIQSVLDTLRSAKEAQFNRLEEDKLLTGHEDAVFNKAIEMGAEHVGKSILIECPEEQDAWGLYIRFEKHLVDKKNTAILYRDNMGQINHVVFKEGVFNAMNAEEFDAYVKEHSPTTYCLYTKDCRGGDFREHSKERVAAQVLYHNTSEDVPEDELYQRLRRNRSDTASPVWIYTGDRQLTRIELLSKAAEAQKAIDKEALNLRIVKKRQEAIRKNIEDLLGKTEGFRIKAEKLPQEAFDDYKNLLVSKAESELAGLERDLNTGLDSSEIDALSLLRGSSDDEVSSLLKKLSTLNAVQSIGLQNLVEFNKGLTKNQERILKLLNPDGIDFSRLPEKLALFKTKLNHIFKSLGYCQTRQKTARAKQNQRQQNVDRQRSKIEALKKTTFVESEKTAYYRKAQLK